MAELKKYLLILHILIVGLATTSAEVFDYYNQFTAKEFKRVLDENKVDFSNNIKDKIISKLIDDSLKSHRNVTSMDSNCGFLGLIASLKYRWISAGISEIEFKLKNLFEKRFIDRRHKLNKIITRSTDLFVSNNSSLEQEVNTISFSYTATEREEVTIISTAEISSSTEINIPFAIKTSFAFKFSGGDVMTRGDTKDFTLTVPSQKITLMPFTKMNITFNLYQYEDIYSYLLDFELDNGSWISYPDFEKDIYYGDSTCCSACFLYKRTATIASPLNAFLRENVDALKNLQHANETSMKLEEINGKLILRNLPATERMVNFGVDILYGIPEEIQSKK